ALRTGRYDDALRAAQDVLAKNPKSGDALMLIAAVHRERLASDQAIEAYKRAAAELPKSPLPPYPLARAYASVGKTDEARASYKKALAIDPQFAAANVELEFLDDKPGTSQAAAALPKRIEDLKARVQKAPEVADLHQALGQAYVTNKQYAEAEAEF